MLYSAYKHKGLTAVRYPRGTGTGAVEQEEMTQIPLGKADTIRNGSNVAILSFGTLLADAIQAGEALDATVINMRFVKPLDADLIEKIAKTHDLIVTLEENVVAGGAGSGVNELLAEKQFAIPTLNLGLPDHYIEHGEKAQLLAECGLDANGIIDSIKSSAHFTQSSKSQKRA